MIISVPHTGTRSLQRHLGEATIFHFGQNEGDFEQIDEVIDFPIRCPLATSLSWRSYQSDRTDMGEFPRWEAAIAYLRDHEHRIHVMERLPVTEGMSNPQLWYKKAYIDRDLESLTSLPEVRYLLEWYPRYEDFFKPHYGDFWWLRKQGTLSS